MIISSDDVNLNPITLTIKYKQSTYEKLSEHLGYSIEELKEFEKLNHKELPLPFVKALKLYIELIRIKLSLKDIDSELYV
ncbi:hypothetical protein [Campylobacter pinnipediorum]|uniref:hypothetical protein n=1 Tax=Campylobacter pinnipediorum TaxID=1965231 RepID=UPI00084DAE20|nr:hypothetical protein [Campylobacter pinnipediorum]